ncbi:DUF4157 domain-containing protein [Nostoc sp. 106C]|uniref:eCIS core domain-containing protein n=1 Tax=Nostoc sp. 106C TaxID=1932667 RepID=UPI001412C3E1|nr:DUF4157 domain-containing protein [Nostoc sp. 106C]
MKKNENQKSTNHQPAAQKPFFGASPDGAFFSADKAASTPFFQPKAVSSSAIQAKSATREPESISQSVVQRMPAFESEVNTKQADLVQRQTDLGSELEEKEPVQRQVEEKEKPFQTKADGKQPASVSSSREQQSNNTGLPDNLKAGIENLSGMAMDDVKVHYNSDKPAQLQALAYTQGKDIHVGKGQDRHLAHEAWHVVQQKQGRVKPTMKFKGNDVNDDPGLENEADVMGARASREQIHNPLRAMPAQTKKANAHFNSIETGKAEPVQRTIIQLVYNADEKLKEAQNKKDQALTKIKSKDYEGARKLYVDVKKITRDIYERNANPSSQDKVFKKHTDGANQCLKELIAGIQETSQKIIDELTNKMKDLYKKYEDNLNQLYEEIASRIFRNQGIKEITEGLTKEENNLIENIEKIANEYKEKELKDFNDKAKEDTDVSYSIDKTRTASISDTKLIPLNFDKFDQLKEKDNELKKQFNTQKKHIKTFAQDPQNETLREHTYIILVAGSEERKNEIAKLFKDEVAIQLTIFKKVNKKHRSDPITDIVNLLQDIGVKNVYLAFNLIEKVGDKGSIAEINLYQKKTKVTKDNPNLKNVIGFLDSLKYASLSKLTDFVAEVGKVCDLVSIKKIWVAAEANSNIDKTISFFNGNNIPSTLAESAADIGLAFAQKTGGSKAEDWAKLLNISEWKKENLIALATAFDKNSGNATAERWTEVAKADPSLETKPDEVRATARLNMFANNDWYDKAISKSSSEQKAQKKYTQLLYALLGEQKLKDLGAINFENIKGDFLSMLVFFHRHIASFKAENGQGFDRDNVGEGKYARSNKDHPLNQQYKELLFGEGVDVSTLLQPLNSALLKLQGGSVTSKPVGSTTYSTDNTGRMSVASAGLPSHNLKILQDQQGIIAASSNKEEAIKKLFKDPRLTTPPKDSRSVDKESSITDELLKKQKDALKEKVTRDARYSNFHDGLLQDRGTLVNQISTAINNISGGKQVLNAIGSEDHPSLILKVPKPSKNFIYNNAEYKDTKKIVSQIAKDFNAAPNQAIKITERGSFGFQRPTIADTGDSVRLWLGYAPIEALLPGLKVIVEKLTSKNSARNLDNINDLTNLKTDTSKPILYIEALKTAMRHAFIVLEKKVDTKASTEKKRVYEWLKSRMLIKLQQAGILLEKGNALYGKDSTSTQEDKNKHFAITADMTDKLQEYSMLYTATTLNSTVNPNADHTESGKFKDDTDVYEKNVISKLTATDYRVFYLDSGEQALITAGILANRFQKHTDENTKNVEKSEYINKNPYFEISVFGGDKRSNLTSNASGNIVHSDLSPVITEGITAPKPKTDTQNEVKRTWQDSNGDVIKSDMIPIIDITNSSIDDVVSLGKMPNNFIIVESLTKHQQLGADKFIMGRLIAVSNTKGTEGNNPLDKTNFLDLAQKIVGPVSNEAYNPLLAKIRANMDKALYSDDLK